MKMSDIVSLAKAGYKPADVLKLLEYVETSPEVQKAASDITPDDVPKDTPDPDPEPEKKVEEKEEETDNDESVLDKLFD